MKRKRLPGAEDNERAWVICTNQQFFLFKTGFQFTEVGSAVIKSSVSLSPEYQFDWLGGSLSELHQLAAVEARRKKQNARVTKHRVSNFPSLHVLYH